jgi:hypothetical protein
MGDDDDALRASRSNGGTSTGVYGSARATTTVGTARARYANDTRGRAAARTAGSATNGVQYLYAGGGCAAR